MKALLNVSGARLPAQRLLVNRRTALKARNVTVRAMAEPSSEELERQMEAFMREQAEAERGASNRSDLGGKVLGADVVSDEAAVEMCRTVTRVLRNLIDKRDMTPNEVKLILAIEDPRAKERRSMGIEDESGVSRDEIAAAFSEVVSGQVPKDRIALKILTSEMEGWPFLDSDAPMKEPGQQSIAEAAGGAPNPAQREKGWRPGQVRPPVGRDKSERPSSILDLLPDWVGYGTLYVITIIPVLIAGTVVAILFFSSLK